MLSINIGMRFKSVFSVFFLLSAVFISCSSDKPEIDISNASFVGRQSCVECHEKEYHSWKGSDHDMAMDSATEETVLGDFNNATFERDGFVSKMYKKDGKFYVYTKGPEGKPGDFQIAYTFGFRPLQQYLVPFEDGRFQCLQITWDTEKKEWYHLSDSVHQGEVIKPDDWLYWTNNGQNWNAMCAECHSTNLIKNYDPKTHIYNTTWSEIDVSCEACHGPASEHLKWAHFPEDKQEKYSNTGLVVKTSHITSEQLVDECAYCHARRSSFGDFIHPRKNLNDIIHPQLPVIPFYHVDGQILEEDYVYSSFTQSKMYMNHVKCTDCHDVHSLKVKYDGENKLCEQCHVKSNYDTYKHHFHKYPGEEGQPVVLNNGKRIIDVGEGSKCINCHMPGGYYMGRDFRRDHSMRIPRPDLSVELGTPNACNSQCHTDKTPKWAASFTEKWYGMKKRPQFAEVFSKAINGDTASITGLANLAIDKLNPPIVRAAATMYLGDFYTENSYQVIKKMLNDPNPMVRNEAVSSYPLISWEDFVSTISPFLTDSSRMVRMNAASIMSAAPIKLLNDTMKANLDQDVKEYIAALNYSADFAASRHNLGNLYSNLGDNKAAEENYLEALRIDNLFYPAKINLAMLYNKLGKNDKAENLLKQVIKDHPQLPDTYYSLGLLMAEKKDFKAAAVYLEKASELMPERARVYYNLAMTLQYLKQLNKAEIAYLKAYELEPENSNYLSALISFYLDSGNKVKTRKYLLKWISLHPDDKAAQGLYDNLR